MSLPRKEMPRSRPSGTKPNRHGPVRKSSASAESCGSGSNGRLRGILMSPPWTNMSASGSRGPNSGGLNGWSAHRRRAATISAVGTWARSRASSSIARAMLPRRRAVVMNTQKLSAKTLTRCAVTVLTSQPTHRLGVASCASSKPSIRFAIWRRCSATAAKTNLSSTRTRDSLCFGCRSEEARYQSVSFSSVSAAASADTHWSRYLVRSDLGATVARCQLPQPSGGIG